MKKIVLTGGSGFIGSNLTRILLKKKYKILVIDKLTYASNANIEKLKHKNFKFIKLDISKKKKLINELTNFKPNYIINCAAETHVDRSIVQSDEFILSNIIGTYNILEFLKKNQKCRLIQISTDEVFGSLKSAQNKFNEKTKYDPKSPYSASKASADHLVRAYGNTYNIDFVITNCSNNFGPFQHPEKFIPTVILSCLKRKKIPIYGNGMNIREWIFVEDHCKGIILCLEKGKSQETYLIGSTYEKSNIYIAKKICMFFNKMTNNKFNHLELISFVKDRKGHDFRYATNYNKIKKKLNFKNDFSFDNGIRKTINFYNDNYKKIDQIFKL